MRSEIAREVKKVLTKEEIRKAALEAKHKKGLKWEQIGKEIGRNAVGAATIVYGYGAAKEDEADKLVRLLDLPAGAKEGLVAAPYRVPAQPWPPTDPFVYRFYEAVMLYGPVWKDVCHEIFGDGIISAIDCWFDIKKVEEAGIARAEFTFNGKWLVYRKF